MNSELVTEVVRHKFVVVLEELELVAFYHQTFKPDHPAQLFAYSDFEQAA